MLTSSTMWGTIHVDSWWSTMLRVIFIITDMQNYYQEAFFNHMLPTHSFCRTYYNCKVSCMIVMTSRWLVRGLYKLGTSCWPSTIRRVPVKEYWMHLVMVFLNVEGETSKTKCNNYHLYIIISLSLSLLQYGIKSIYF